MSAIIIISGPVAAGKTTVARAIVARSPASFCYIDGDTFWSFFPAGTRPGPKRFRLVMSAMTAAAVPFAAAGHDVLVDFSIPPWFLDTARKIASVRSVPIDYVVIRPSEEVCAARAAARREGRIIDYAPYRELYADFADTGRHALSDDAAAPADLAERIRAGLAAGAFRLAAD